MGYPLLKNLNFVDFLNLFYSHERPDYILKYRKTHFPGPHFPKKVGKMAIFGPKPWVNLFRKISIV